MSVIAGKPDARKGSTFKFAHGRSEQKPFAMGEKKHEQRGGHLQGTNCTRAARMKSNFQTSCRLWGRNLPAGVAAMLGALGGRSSRFREGLDEHLLGKRKAGGEAEGGWAHSSSAAHVLSAGSYWVGGESLNSLPRGGERALPMRKRGGTSITLPRSGRNNLGEVIRGHRTGKEGFP